MVESFRGSGYRFLSLHISGSAKSQTPWRKNHSPLPCTAAKGLGFSNNLLPQSFLCPCPLLSLLLQSFLMEKSCTTSKLQKQMKLCSFSSQGRISPLNRIVTHHIPLE